LSNRLRRGKIEGNDCIRIERQGENSDDCAVLSPARWWKDEQSLLNDEDVHDTLSQPPSLADQAEPRNLPLTLSETFVGIGTDRSGSIKTAQHLILTFFLQDVPSRSTLALPTSTSSSSNSTVLEDSERESAKLNWRRAVRQVIEGINTDDRPEDEEGRDKDQIVLGILSESKSSLTRHVLLKVSP